MKITCFLIALVSIHLSLFSQSQSISGVIKDQFNQSPIADCSLELIGENLTTFSDSLGYFKFENLSSGRKIIEVRKGNYANFQSEAFILSSQKPVFMEVYLSQNVKTLNEVKVSARAPIKTTEAQNEFAYTSSRSFTAEETERTPVGLNDPSRMALSLPGVRKGGGDLENHISIRGNSPFGVSWRVEGIDIPNPNHFTKHGSAGGGVSVFSGQLIGKSDFYIGAMPAEFGNALAGSFDIRFRQGNPEEKHYKIRASFLGLDASAEGPLQKGRSSYVLNYRYSTLGLMNWLSFYLVGNRTVDTFQDLSFNLAFNSKNRNHLTTVFGVSGTSMEHSFPEPIPEKRQAGVLDDWEDRRRPSNMAATGITHTRNLNNKSSLKMVLALTGSWIYRTSDTLGLDDSKFRYNSETYVDKRIATSVSYNRQFTPSLKLKMGAQFNFINFNFNRETYPRIGLVDLSVANAGHLIWANGQGNSQTAQLYALLQKNIGNKFYMNGGIHYFRFFLNGSQSLEPRIALKYSPNSRNIFAVSAGLHSQLLPLSTYFVSSQSRVNEQIILDFPYKNLAFPKSQHYVASYRWLGPEKIKITTELYYQYIYNSLVENHQGSVYWMLNSADGYPGLSDLVARGKGYNKGIDLTLEKLFYDKYFLLFTTSLFDAKYKTVDGNRYNSSFNGRYGGSLTFGREFSLRKKRVIQSGFRVLTNGGFLYSEPDVILSDKYNTFIPEISTYNTFKAPAYKRIDARVAYRFNGLKTSGQMAIDIQNVSGYQNYSRAYYNLDTKTIELQKKGTGFTPIASLALEI